MPRHKGVAECFGPGDEVANPLPGDFILTHGKSWTSRMIRVGEKLRYWGRDRIYTRWNHAAIFVDTNGDIVEALGGGVQRRNISVYKNTEYHVVHLENVVDVDREHETGFALACLGDKYGWLTILSIALSLLFASKLGFGVDGQEICSALVARCLERTGEIFPEDPWRIMPADLAKYFDVRPANPKAPTGNIPPADEKVKVRSK
jgi:uncharacterized protein YycO